MLGVCWDWINGTPTELHPLDLEEQGAGQTLPCFAGSRSGDGPAESRTRSRAAPRINGKICSEPEEVGKRSWDTAPRWRDVSLNWMFLLISLGNFRSIFDLSKKGMITFSAKNKSGYVQMIRLLISK